MVLCLLPEPQVGLQAPQLPHVTTQSTGQTPSLQDVVFGEGGHADPAPAAGVDMLIVLGLVPGPHVMLQTPHILHV